MAQTLRPNANDSSTTYHNFPHRFYHQPLPTIGHIVAVKALEIISIGLLVQLLEYGERKGIILLDEISKRQKKKLISSRKISFATVVRVDIEKGFIDLSFKRTEGQDISEARERFKKSHKLHSILSRVAQDFDDFSWDQVYQYVVWPLYSVYDHALDGLINLSEIPLDDNIVFPYVNRKAVNEQILLSLYDALKRAFRPPLACLRAVVDISCAGIKGVEAVKSSILSGISVSNTIDNGSTHTNDIRVKLVSPPRFEIVCIGQDRDYVYEKTRLFLCEAERYMSCIDGGTFKILEEVALLGDEEFEVIDYYDSSTSDEKSQ